MTSLRAATKPAITGFAESPDTRIARRDEATEQPGLAAGFRLRHVSVQLSSVILYQNLQLVQHRRQRGEGALPTHAAETKG